MKKGFFLSWLYLSLINFCQGQNELYNAGCLIYIDSLSANTNNTYSSSVNPSLFIGGSLINGISGVNIGTITNKGEIQISGDWTQNDNATYNSTGDEVFLGANSGVINTTQNKYKQRITGNTSGAFTGTTKDFNNMLIVKPARTSINESIIELGVNVEVLSNIKWLGTGGVIRTDITSQNDAGELYTKEIYLKNPSSTALSGFNWSVGSTDKYFEGKLRRQVNAATAYRFPIGVDPYHSIGGLNAIELTFTSAPTNAGLLAYLEKSGLVAMGNSGYAYCDVGKDPTSGGTQPFSLCSGGPDGIQDQIKCTKNQSYQWSVTTNTAGSFSYNIEVFPTANCELNAAGDLVPVACSTPYSGYIMEWLAHNGIPLGNATTVTPGFFTQAGYSICPQSSSAYKKITGQSGFSKFRLHGAIITETVLPIELISFTGHPEGPVNRLLWETASEINTKWHVIERSSFSNFQFSEIGRVDAAGNSSSNITYQLTDNFPEQKNYYRLKTIDNDGTFSYSNIILIERTGNEINAGIYPNPTKDEVVYAFQNSDIKNIRFSIIDVLGRIISEEEITAYPGFNEKRFDMSQLAKAVYLIQVDDGSAKAIYKIVKQ